MTASKWLSLIAPLALALAFSVSTAQAQVSNQATQMTFEQPVRVPGQVLPAGTYWFTVKDMGTDGDLNQVQISNASGTKVIGQFQTANAAPAEEGQGATINGVHWPNSNVVLTFAEGRNGQPATLIDWYYPWRPSLCLFGPPGTADP